MSAPPAVSLTSRSSNGGDAVRPVGAGDTEAAERKADIADLTRRVVVGAVLTAPVLFAAMTESFLHLLWLPPFLLNPHQAFVITG